MYRGTVYPTLILDLETGLPVYVALAESTGPRDNCVDDRRIHFGSYVAITQRSGKEEENLQPAYKSEITQDPELDVKVYFRIGPHTRSIGLYGQSLVLR